MEDSMIVKTTAIVAVCVLEAIALLSGVDGALLALSFSFIGGIAGYEAGKKA